MAEKGMTLAIVLLVAGLAVGAGIGYFAAPKTEAGSTVLQTVDYKYPLEGVTVKLGYIASSTTAVETGQPYRKQIIEVDNNKYAELLGYNTKFEWLVDNANGESNTHLVKVQGFLSQGVTSYEGGGWSAQATAALSYTNDNHMLMWSSSSTSPTLAIANDRLYRMCPADTYLAPALVSLMWNYGIKSVAVVQRGDSWGDGIVNLFKPAWAAKGGAMAGDVIRYAEASTEFANYLQQADQAIATAKAAVGDNRVGVLVLAFDEASILASQASGYANAYNVPWFGSDGTAMSVRLKTDAPEAAVHMQFLSLMAAQTQSVKYDSLAERYTAAVNQPLGSYNAYSYDIATVIIGTTLQAASIKADDIVPLQAAFAYDTFGAGGWCRLNQYGDRAPPPFAIWTFHTNPAGGAADVASVGEVNAETLAVTWDLPVLGYTPPGP